MKTYVSLFVLVLALVSCTKKPVATPEPETLLTEEQKVAYSVGVSFGESLKAQELNELDMDIIVQGMQDVFQDNELQISSNDATPMIKAYIKKKRDAAKIKNKADGESFLATNKTKEGIIETESGLQYRIIKEGTGDIPTSTSEVEVHYTGKLIDGTVFDTSKKDEFEPLVIRANRVIKGWTEALTLMPVGSKWEVFIPAELAYGERGAGSDIPPNSVIIFEMELLGFE